MKYPNCFKTHKSGVCHQHANCQVPHVQYRQSTGRISVHQLFICKLLSINFFWRWKAAHFSITIDPTAVEWSPFQTIAINVGQCHSTTFDTTSFILCNDNKKSWLVCKNDESILAKQKVNRKKMMHMRHKSNMKRCLLLLQGCDISKSWPIATESFTRIALSHVSILYS